MSVQATSWVIENSRHKGSALLLLIMIANHAHADGTNAFPSVKTLARECRMSERQIIRLVKVLEDSKELMVDHSAGRSSHLYTVVMKKIELSNTDNLSGLNGKSEGSNTDKMSGLTDSNPDKLSPSTLTNPTLNPDILQPAQELQNIENNINPHEPSGVNGKYAPPPAVPEAVEQLRIYERYYPGSKASLSIFQQELLATMTNLEDCEAAIRFAAGNGISPRSVGRIVDLVYKNREWLRPAGRSGNDPNKSRIDSEQWRNHYADELRKLLAYAESPDVKEAIEQALRDFPTMTHEEWVERRGQLLDFELEIA